MAEIRIQQLSFRYPGADTDTLADLNLDIESGEAHALLGGSGAGKSTLLNLLSGLLPMDRGQMIFNGEDVGARAPLARRVSQVFQFPVLYEAMTVEDNLRFPLRCAGAPRATQRARAADIARRLHLEGLLKRKPARLSLVEKQLVAIGKSLVRPDVSLVLLDEPLTAAQPAYKWQLRQALKSVQRELGTTMVYVTHDQTEALTFADRISVLHEGRIVQTASPELLVTQPAHEHVGYFVGSPGMNFLDARIESGAYRVDGTLFGATAADDGICRVGFRPEWARLENGARPDRGACLAARILQTRILGTVQGSVHGLVTARCGEAEVTTRQSLDGVSPGDGWLCLDPQRIFGFRDGLRIDHAQ
ncbi:MAG: ABC transporter ATP-binding protein [Pseudomonadales bacterium]